MPPIALAKWTADGDAVALLSSWSLVHLASGVVAGGLTCWYIKNSAVTIATTTLIALLAFQLWEIFEYVGYRNSWDAWPFVYEHPLNRMADIVVDCCGYLLVVWATGVDVF